MGQTYCGVSGIDTLSTVTRRTHYVNAAVVHIDLNIYFFCFRHNGYGCCRGMDTAAGLCLRHTLYTMYTTLVF